MIHVLCSQYKYGILYSNISRVFIIVTIRLDIWGTAMEHILARCHQTIDITRLNQRISSLVDASLETMRILFPILAVFN